MTFDPTSRAYGISLMIGSLLMILTMVLHPIGGDFNHLLRILTMGRIAHIIGIASIPLITYGFWGLSQTMQRPLADISFCFMLFGLIAVMLAGTTNGLILMDFVQDYEGASEETIASLTPFFRLIRNFNHAFDFLFIGAVCISTGLWSATILRQETLPKLLGWFGMVITIAALVSLLAGFVFVDVHGFRIFIFGWVAWVIVAGYQLAFRKIATST